MFGEFKTMDADETRDFLQGLKPGQYELLDVRQPWEYEEEHIPGARLAPLPELEEHLGGIPGDRPLVVYCKSGGRSSAAAGMLTGKGFSVVVNMAGGMEAWTGAGAVGPPQAGLARFTGDESPREIVAMACAMEDNLGDFYKAVAGKTPGTEAAETLLRLAGFEEKHKNWLMAVYRRMTGEELSPEDLPMKAAGPALEGGFTAEEFIAANRPFFDDPASVIETAMMFEAQAMDMYSRLAMNDDDPETKELLLKIANEEKAHLKALGTLMDRMAPAK